MAWFSYDTISRRGQVLPNQNSVEHILGHDTLPET